MLTGCSPRSPGPCRCHPEVASLTRQRVVSGMRPTGQLHLGHLVGALQNWVKLQSQYDCFYFVADWHALTSALRRHRARSSRTRSTTSPTGLAPASIREHSTLFVQSLVPEHAELYLLLQMVTPIPWLERVPTYKEQIEQLARQGSLEHRLSRLSAAADRRRRHLQRAFRAGGGGSGRASRAVARGRAPVPQPLRRGLRRAAAAAHRRRRGCPGSTTGR